jgi:catechol 2,3-dioxygenase-like lactoylglutathione lyase family enzyme
VALHINNAREVVDFYQNILELELVYQFELSKELSQSIFGMNHSLPVYYCKKEQVAFELFVFPEQSTKGLAHICIQIPNREQLITKCNNRGYRVNNIQRDSKPNLLLVWDKSGNCFEIKAA